MIDGIPISTEKCLYHWGKKWHYEKDVEEERSTNKKDYSKSHQSHSRNKSKSQFTCCNARALAQGCCSAKCHVWRGKLFSSSGMHGPFTGYVRTKKVTIILYLNANIKRLFYFILFHYCQNIHFIFYQQRKHSPPNGYHGVYAIDCEMCYTTNGMEVILLFSSMEDVLKLVIPSFFC